MRLPRHRWRDLQSLMNAYEIVVHEVDNGHAQSRRVRSQEGMEVPTPPSPINLLARKFTEAVRDETKTDPKTGKPVPCVSRNFGEARPAFTFRLCRY